MTAKATTKAYATLEAENAKLRADLEFSEALALKQAETYHEVVDEKLKLEKENAALRKQSSDLTNKHLESTATASKKTAEAAGFKRFLRLIRDLINHELGEVPGGVLGITPLLLAGGAMMMGLLGYLNFKT